MPIAFSPDSKLLASSSGRHIQLWSTATSTLQPNPEAIRSKPSVFLAFSFDLELLASACGGDEIQIRSTTTGVLTQTFPDDFAGSITAMVFSPDSTLLAWYSPYLYPKIKIWSIVSNRLQHVFKPGHVASMAFSHDSKLLALRLYGGETHIWSAVTGRQQGVLEYNNDDIISSMFTFSNQESDYGYDDRGWITFRRNRLLWIPKDFQPSRYTISGSTIAIQSYSGTVVGLGLNAGNLAS
ncbi:hypothetical protein GGR51DRAFT_55404 [Nemania sp. FL0031]|nr:hypothetical protein GGR51DRAFT_55404 [Nemania sp. FL0031]